MNGIGWWVGAGIIIIQLVVVSFLIRNYVSIFDPTITLSDFLSAVSWIIGFVGIFYRNSTLLDYTRIVGFI